VLEAAVIVARLLQYLGAAILFGSSLFFVYALPPVGPGSASSRRWARPLLLVGAAVLAASSLLAIAAQASLFAGSWAAGLAAGAIADVVTYMDLGKAALVRGVAALAAIGALLALGAGRGAWLAVAACGAVAAASLAWMGHAAAGEGATGTIHLASDALHALAAAAWLGALAAFVLLLFDANPAEGVVQRALRRFSGVGSALVAVLVVTGAVNTWFLVGPDRLAALPDSAYGRLLLAKLALFGVMLALAGLNRWRLAPRLGSAAGPAAAASLRRSILAETVTGVAVLALVAWLGTLPPPPS
jgi:putative copper resistance protein D